MTTIESSKLLLMRVQKAVGLIHRLRDENKELQAMGTAAQTYASTMIPAVVSISFLTYMIVSLFGGFMVLNGITTLGALASYLVFVRQAAAPINQFTQQSNFLLSSLAGAERIFELIDTEPEEDEGNVTLTRMDDSWAWNDGDREIPLRGDVRFFNVDFSYDKNHQILHDISLYAKPGQKIAFVGSTGAGKTTITNLINRFYDIEKGEIIFDGKVINDKKTNWTLVRQKIGMVFQSYELFPHMSVIDNITLAPLKVEKRQKDEVISEAYDLLKRFNLLDKKDSMPRSLSGGQKQRVAIIRALCMNPDILLFDEVTASLDPEMAYEVSSVILELAKDGMTMIIVTHEMRFAKSIASEVIFLDNGSIVEKSYPADFFNNPKTERARKFLSIFNM